MANVFLVLGPPTARAVMWKNYYRLPSATAQNVLPKIRGALSGCISTVMQSAFFKQEDQGESLSAEVDYLKEAALFAKSLPRPVAKETEDRLFHSKESSQAFI